MKIRKKFSLLGIVLVVIPLVSVTYFQHSSMTQFGTNLAEHTGKILVRKERALLLKIVQDYSAILHRDKRTHERALTTQVREVERLLAQDPPSSPSIHFPEAFRKDGNPLPGLGLDYTHMRQTGSRKDQQIWVNYDYQVVRLTPGTSRSEVSRDLARVSGLTESYRFIYRLHPDHILWQQTVLASGVQSTYPAHAEFPEGYDPREEKWYRLAKQEEDLVRVVSTNVASQAANQILARPIHTPKGRFLGVTAISVPYERAFSELQHATIWEASATAMLATYQPEITGRHELQILAKGTRKDMGTWRDTNHPRGTLFDTIDIGAYPNLLKTIASGTSEVHKIRRQGREILLAHGAHRKGEPFPLILLPYQEIVAQAEAEQETIRNRTSQYILFSGMILLAAVGLSLLLALWSARSITRPVMQLTRAARKLAQGNFQTRIDLQSRDEMQELGTIFNNIGPKLEEHKRMSQAMEVAKKAQNYLLPRYAPKTEGFDIYGTSIYSDETGGDYYDFIEVERPGSNRLAITVGDVSGHGLGAAFLMASARGIIRAHAIQYRMDLQDLLRTLNSQLVRDSRDDQFLTLFYAVLDPESHTLTWISAGHEPALLYRARSGSIEDIPSSGMPLGISAHAVHDRQQSLVLDPGDILLVGTDGIREARNASREMFGRERVQAILAQNAEKTTQEICQGIVDSLRSFCSGCRQEDDITLVAIKYQPKASGSNQPA